MKDIETLLNKYFEGETTCEEERRLRRFFAEGLVPEHLEVYRPMFAFFEAEQKELPEISGIGNAVEMPELPPFCYWWASPVSTVIYPLHRPTM